jgi:hypothetical protein
MRSIITCLVCLCPLFCAGCFGFEKAFQEALSQALLELAPVVMIDESLSGVEQAVLETQGPRPEFLPWFTGAEIARIATRMGLTPVAPPRQGQLLMSSVAELYHSLWDFLRWLSSRSEEELRIVRA